MIQAAATGAVLLFCYSILRGLRRIWHHSAFFTGAEDLLYWLASALWVFARVYRNNDGILRLFMVPGMIAGALLCHFFLEKMIKWLLFPVRRCKLSLYKHIKKGRMAHWVILRRKKEKRK
nr:spore cortex biosynthesis protein YabQ [Blautia luti]